MHRPPFPPKRPAPTLGARTLDARLSGRYALLPVCLVGAGPGDPELLTVKASRRIATAEVVVFDRLVSQDILDLIPTGTTRIYAGKALNRHELPQEEINLLLLNLARSGRRVVRLKGGDPFVFGRGSEEALFLARHGIRFEVVPGITAASGCGSYAGIPLTHRGLATSVRYLTGRRREHLPPAEDWRRFVDPQTTLVLYMSLSRMADIAARLIEAGMPRDMPAAAIENGTLPGQRRVLSRLDRLAEDCRLAAMTPPTTIIIGHVVSLAEALTWFGEEADASPEAHTAGGPIPPDGPEPGNDHKDEAAISAPARRRMRGFRFPGARRTSKRAPRV
jgi:uroporphyrin-III C-methyltransferase/precorrin-2 dehydrogenase/sirohydrochlorin ferrochelatase/uroporphyrin-III C-methyltransferase